MNPILVIGVVFLVLLACGVVFDLSGRDARDLGLGPTAAPAVATSRPAPSG